MAVVLQHDAPVEVSLSRLKPGPLLPGEVYGHVSECHWPLEGQTGSNKGSKLRQALTKGGATGSAEGGQRV